MFVRLFILLLTFFSFFISSVIALENCKWDNRAGIPCVTISKTPNTSMHNSEGVNKVVFTKQQIIDSGATTAVDVLKKVLSK